MAGGGPSGNGGPPDYDLFGYNYGRPSGFDGNGRGGGGGGGGGEGGGSGAGWAQAFQHAPVPNQNPQLAGLPWATCGYGGGGVYLCNIDDDRDGSQSAGFSEMLEPLYRVAYFNFLSDDDDGMKALGPVGSYDEFQKAIDIFHPVNLPAYK